MTTSGLTTFNLDLNNLVEEAFERCGSQLRSGYDMRTARRSLNLLSIEWANRGINLWTIEQGQINLVTGQALYAIPNNTIDLLDMVIRQNNGSASNQVDINISRISESTYSTIPNKLTTGRPIQVWINRQTAQTNAVATTVLANNSGTVSATATSINVASSANLPSAGFVLIGTEVISYPNIVGNTLTNCARGQNGTTAATHADGASVTIQNLPCINIWPAPDAGGAPYTFVYWRMRRIQDAGNGATEQDIPFRLLPCMVAGLAFYMAQKLPEGQPRIGF
jgi:hypothetical protein